MTRTETERLAILETEFKHVSQGMEDLKATNAELMAALVAMKETIAGWDNQFKGGRTVLAALFSLAAAAGGGIVWLWQHLPAVFPHK